MSRRIEIELTSTRPDGTWTWRAAGAQKPKGVLDGTLLPSGAAVGQVFKADADAELDGLTIVAVAAGKPKTEKSGLLELIPSDKPFEAVTQTLARKERGDRGDRRDRGDRPDRPRGDRPDRPRGDRPPRSDGDRAPSGDRAPRGDRPPRGDGERGPRPDRGPRPGGDRKPRFQAPPELPQRPKAKRLKPGRVHRNAVLAELPEAQRTVAERVLQGGIPAVRQAVNEQNARLRSEGKDEIPAAGLLAIAEQLQPKLRVAEWLDRADAAKSDIEELDLRDLRSVVAAGEDPMVARDESTREIAAELKVALVTKQEKELALWFGDIDAAIGVGRVVRALKLSSQPPKAGVRFPSELATKLAEAATANLTTDALPDRWSAVLEAVAFSPVRTQVTPAAKPTQENDELLATVKRLGSLLPQVAALFGIAVDPKAATAKPLRPTKPVPPQKAPAKKAPGPKADAAAKPVAAPVAAAPVAAAQTEPVPVEAEAAPVEAEVVPVEAEVVPVEAEAAPVEASPVETETVPVEAEVVPVEAAPVEAEVAQVEAAPVEAEAAPVEAEVVPVEAEAAPVEAAPVETEPEAAAVEAAPAADAEAVASEPEAPAADEPATDPVD